MLTGFFFSSIAPAPRSQERRQGSDLEGSTKALASYNNTYQYNCFLFQLTCFETWQKSPIHLEVTKGDGVLMQREALQTAQKEYTPILVTCFENWQKKPPGMRPDYKTWQKCVSYILLFNQKIYLRMSILNLMGIHDVTCNHDVTHLESPSTWKIMSLRCLLDHKSKKEDAQVIQDRFCLFKQLGIVVKNYQK